MENKTNCKKYTEEQRNALIRDAENHILNEESFTNIKIDETSLINLLMEKHKINVPTLTKSWINNKLTDIIFTKIGDEKTHISSKCIGSNSVSCAICLYDLIKTIKNH